MTTGAKCDERGRIEVLGVARRAITQRFHPVCVRRPSVFTARAAARPMPGIGLRHELDEHATTILT